MQFPQTTSIYPGNLTTAGHWRRSQILRWTVVDNAIHLSYRALSVASPCIPDATTTAYLEENPRSILTEKFGYETRAQSMDCTIYQRRRCLWIRTHESIHGILCLYAPPLWNLLRSGVAATVYLQHCHSEDDKIRNEALGEYRTAIDFLTRASHHYKALKTAVLPPHYYVC